MVKILKLTEKRATTKLLCLLSRVLIHRIPVAYKSGRTPVLPVNL